MKPKITDITLPLSVDDTIYFQDAHEDKRHAANFRGWIGDNACIVWKGKQFQVEKERIFINNKGDNHNAKTV